MRYQLIIIGSGPAGLTASLYAGRRELKTLVIGKATGGQMGIAHEIENWPGDEIIAGFELADKMKKQATKWGAEFVSGEVLSLSENDGIFFVKTETETYEAEAVILAFGLTPRNLGVTGEKELIGKGVSYCATCDGPFFKNKTVAVVGDGNSALEASEYLSKLASKVYLITKHQELKGENALINSLKKLDNLEIFCCQKIEKINGKEKVESLSLVDTVSGETKELPIDGLFVEIGYSPATSWLSGFVDLNERGEIITDKLTQTNRLGVFGAGDCTDVGHKQIVIASGEGAKSALSAYKFLVSKNGGVAIPDWGGKK